jgi:prepilin-type N-terminal cleavage/methylation domain-containing protein
VRILKNNDGFTLIELIIVITILALVSAITLPRISSFFGGGKGDILVLRSFIAKTFDNAFLKGERSLLVVHCSVPDPKAREYDPDGIFVRENGVSVAVLNKDGLLADSKNRALAFHRFPAGFKIERVILSNGEKIEKGSAMIPFDTDGMSNDAIIHITIGNDPYSVIIYRLRKEPMSTEGYVDFDAVRNGEIL